MFADHCGPSNTIPKLASYTSQQYKDWYMLLSVLPTLKMQLCSASLNTTQFFRKKKYYYFSSAFWCLFQILIFWHVGLLFHTTWLVREGIHVFPQCTSSVSFFCVLRWSGATWVFGEKWYLKNDTSKMIPQKWYLKNDTSKMVPQKWYLKNDTSKMIPQKWYLDWNSTSGSSKLYFTLPVSHSVRHQRPARERHKICIASRENVDNQTPRNTNFTH